ncbi:MAG: diguanylate cyclase [Thermodesulfovibrionales bacterium]|nr:diguanylate cyclase [Thermodesulfovibrionales bacterium]
MTVKLYLQRILNLMIFKDIPIKKKFLFYSMCMLFMFLVVSFIGLVTMIEMESKSQRIVEVIEPHQRTGHIIVRKIRGLSISAHKMVLATDIDEINGNYLRAKARLEDVRSYANKLINGGSIVDYSRATGHLFTEFNVVPLTDPDKIKVIKELYVNLDAIDVLLDEIVQIRSSNIKDTSAIDKISEIDSLVKDSVTLINDYTLTLEREWKTFSNLIRSRLALSLVLIVIFIVSSVIMSFYLSYKMGNVLFTAVNGITEQIKSLSAGEVDLRKKLDVMSKDELGDLTKEFNNLIDTIQSITNFKRVIEEDESVYDIYIRLGNVFIEHLKLESCVIYEITDSGKGLSIVYPPGAEGMELYCKKDIFSEADLCRVKRTGHIVSSAEYPQICKYYLEPLKMTHVCFPVIVSGKVACIIQITCGKLNYCDINILRNKISRAQQFIREVQPVLEAKKLMRELKESSIRDPLTGLYNRRYLEESYDKLVSGTFRRGTNLGLLMCDLDFFKQVNDVYGHDAGDIILKETANVLKNSVRGADIVIRFGGEEFLIILVDTTIGSSIMVAEKIRQRIEETTIQIRTEVLKKTISIGVSEFPKDTENFWEAIKYADVALYKAKEMGRNRVVRFEPSMWQEESY